MRKFLAVVKHEYKKIVLKWSFIIGTLLFPVIAAGFAIVPAIIFSIKGEPTRIVVVDQSGRITPRLKENLSAERMKAKQAQAMKNSMKNMEAPADERMKNSAEQFVESFVFTDYDADEKPLEQIRRELNGKIIEKEFDAYLIIPNDFAAADAKFEFRSRKAGAFAAERNLNEALNEAVRSERLAKANINETQLKDLSKNVDFDAKSVDEQGAEKDSDSVFVASFVIGFMIYITLAIYGQMILSAVVEEKETRIAEILFSSARPFELMMGKLVGV
ncbi:MAG TPA: ABC transporter permease, partial [Pyrinomonadaceae bacterium]|nr:ABC transporter permease [Pyrinomonadaceae bacterium]